VEVSLKYQNPGDSIVAVLTLLYAARNVQHMRGFYSPELPFLGKCLTFSLCGAKHVRQLSNVVLMQINISLWIDKLCICYAVCIVSSNRCAYVGALLF
jgi:hypothetical protein